MSHDKRNDNGSEKGFSGFESLLSDLDSGDSQDNNPADEPDDGSDQPTTPRGQCTTGPSPQKDRGFKRHSDGARRDQMLAIAFLVVLCLIAVWSGLNESSAGGSSPPPGPRVSGPALAQPTQEASREALPAAFPLEVSRPPIGTNRVLSSPQLRYCVAEDIRIDAADAVVSNYDGDQVDRFNAMVDDYNSRCAEFRYRQGTLQTARETVERYRSQLEAEGRARFVGTGGSIGAGSGLGEMLDTMALNQDEQATSTQSSVGASPFTGTWVGTYNCNQGLTTVRVTLRDDGAGQVRGLFSFSAHPTNPYVESGSYMIRGEVTPTGYIVVNGTTWVDQPFGYDMVGFTGKITGSSITGEIPFGGCTWIQLDHDPSDQ